MLQMLAQLIVLQFVVAQQDNNKVLCLQLKIANKYITDDIGLCSSSG